MKSRSLSEFRFAAAVVWVVLSVAVTAASDAKKPNNCALVVQPRTASGNVPPPGLIVWVSPAGGPPVSQILTASPSVRFDGIPCGATNYGVFLPIPDMWEQSQLLAQGSLEKIGRDTVVEPVVPDLHPVTVELVTTEGAAVESRVHLLSWPPHSDSRFTANMATGDSGRVTFVVPTARYALVAPREVRRFVLAEIDGQATQSPVIVDVRDDVLVRFVLRPREESVPVQGRLIDDHGNPLAGPTVVFKGGGDDVHASTDEHGAFEAHLPPSGFPWATDLDDDSGRWRLAQTVQILEAPRDDLVLTAASLGAKVRGRVVNEKGNPVPQAWIMMEGCAGDDEFAYDTHSGATGEFELGCKAGCSMAIEVTTNELMDHRRVLGPETCNGEPVVIRLQRGARLSGRVTAESGLPAPGILLAAVGPGSDETDVTAADGSYELTSLASGRVRVTMKDFAKYYENHFLRLSGSSGELVDAEITVEGPGEINRNLVVVEGGAICFDLPDLYGMSSLDFSMMQLIGIRVLLFEDEARPRTPTPKLIDFDEERAIGCVRGVRPGLVRLWVLDNTESGRVAPPWGPSDDEPGIVEVRVRPGGKQVVDLEWQPQSHVGCVEPLEVRAVAASPEVRW